MITIVIPTSPSMLNPSTRIIKKTIKSIRKYLPDSPLIITCDGCTPETEKYRPQYLEFCAKLLLENFGNDVEVKIYSSHRHQSGMMLDIIDMIKTDQIFYLEHDWEIVGEIPFREMSQIIEDQTADLIRILYPTELPPYYMDKMIGEPEVINGVRLIKTFQWSQNPHLASTSFYRKILAEYFKEDKPAFIEEGIIAAVEKEYRENGFNKFKTFIYVPEGNTQRAIHLDGRNSKNL